MQAAAGTNPEHQSTSMSVQQLIQKAYQFESVSITTVAIWHPACAHHLIVLISYRFADYIDWIKLGLKHGIHASP